MSDRIRGFERRALSLDFDLYRRRVPIAGLPGAELSVIDMRPEGVAQTILLQHGYAGCAETWEHQITALSAHYRVVAPDLRGHGQSDAPYSRYSMDELVTDLLQIADVLELPERFVLAGHSFGGAVALEFADRHPERLERLILVATPAAFPLPRSVGLLSRVPTAVYRLLWRWRPRWNAAPHVLKRMMLGNMRRWQGDALLARLELPTLLIQGARDSYFPSDVYQRVWRALPRAERVDVGGSKHKVQLERHQAVTRAIRRFLQAGADRNWREEPIDAMLALRRPWLGQYAAGCPPTVPLPHQALHAFSSSSRRRHPRHIAVQITGSRGQSYEQLDRRGNQLARALFGMGLGRGAPVAVHLTGRPALPMVLFGILKAGSVAAFSGLGMDELEEDRVEELAERLRAAGARALIAETGDALAWRAARSAGLQKCIGIGGIKASDASGTSKGPAPDRRETELEVVDALDIERGPLGLDALLVDVEDDDPGIEVRPEDPAVMLFGGGPRPGPVALSHAQVVANAIQLRHWLPQLRDGRERVLAGLPLDQSFGLMLGIGLTTLIGGSLILPADLRPESLLRAARRSRPSLIFGPPSLYSAWLDAPDSIPPALQGVKACIVIGAPMPVEQAEVFERIAGIRLVEAYGRTAAGGLTHANPVSERRRCGSIGLPLPNTDLRVVDDRGRDLAPGVIGRMLLRGPQVAGLCESRLAQDGASRMGAQREARGCDAGGGWLDSGDLAQMDASGFFRLLGGPEDQLQTAGGGVYARDVIEVLLERGELRDAALLPVPGPAGGQRVRALVQARPGLPVDLAAVATHCRSRLPERAWPIEIRLLEKLPRDAGGRLRRERLRELWDRAPAGWIEREPPATAIQAAEPTA